MRQRFAVVAFLAVVCVVSPSVGHADGAAEHRAWGYRGEVDKIAPADWPGVCQGARTPSPLDVTRAASDGRPAETIGFDYEPARSWIADNGHAIAITRLKGTVQVPSAVERGSWRRSQPWTLCEIHFHTPSEHTIENVGTAAEVHFVHKDNCADARKILVVGSLIAPASPAHPENSTLAAYLANIRSLPSETAELDPKPILPDAGYYQYEGSLTSPPCTAGVKWFLAHDPVYLSRETLDALYARYPDNARPGQPRNGRKIRGVTPR